MRICGCWRGVLRVLAVKAVLNLHGTPDFSSLRPGRTPNLVLRDVSIVSCGTGVRMDGGHADIEGLEIIDTQVGIEVNMGPTVNVRRARFRPGV